MRFINSQENTFHPEIGLLLSCSRISLEAEETERIQSLAQKNIDWSYLLGMALRHRVMPLMYRSLYKTCPDLIPPVVLNQFRNHFYGNTLRNIFMTRELLKLLNLFETHKISAIPYKGPILADSIYGDIALRQFCDLDILIQKQDIMKARDLLVPLGYQPHFQLTDVNAIPYLKSQNELSFTRRDGKVNLELQWEIVPCYFNFPIASLELWDDLKRTMWEDSWFLTPSPEIMLIIICVHGTKDQWGQLSWICDVNELLRVYKGLDWKKIIELTNKLGGRRMLFLGLSLAKELLNASIPEEVLKQINTNPKVKKLSLQVQQRLFQESDGSSGILREYFFYLKSRERLQDRIKYSILFALTTKAGDLAILTLPKPLFFLYYLIRPIRLIGKYWPRIVKFFIQRLNHKRN